MTSSLWAQVARGEHPWRQSHPESWLNTGPGRLGTRPLEIFPECHLVSSDLGINPICVHSIYFHPSTSITQCPPKSKCSHNPLHFSWKEKKKITVYSLSPVHQRTQHPFPPPPRQNPCEGVSRQTDECNENVICQISQHLWSQRSQLMPHLWGWQELTALSTVSVHKSSCYCTEYKVLHVLWLKKKRRKNDTQ